MLILPLAFSACQPSGLVVTGSDSSAARDATLPDTAAADAGLRDAPRADRATGVDTGLHDARAADAGDFPEDPVLFVPGYAWQAADFDEFRAYFVAQGYPPAWLDAIQFDNTIGSSVAHARDELAPFVDALRARTGRSKVDIVAHSMGCLATRLYVVQYGGLHKVRDVVLLAGPNHGSSGACYGVPGEGAQEQCPAYADEASSVNGVQWLLNGDPDSADVDETPNDVTTGGEIAYSSIRFSGDLIVFPHDVSCLNQQRRGDCADGVNLKIDYGGSHTGMLHDQAVWALVLAKARASRGP